MVRKTTLSVVALTCLVATSTSWAEAPPVATTEPAVVEQSSDIGIMYPIVLATGALAGVLAVNAMTYSIGTLPLSIGMSSSAPFVSPAAAAASRIFVITSGVLGAWLADTLYTSSK